MHTRFRRQVAGLFSLLAALLMAVLAAVLFAAALALEADPAVAARHDVEAVDVDRAVALLRQQDPRRLPAGAPRRVVLSERDLDLLARHAARRWLDAEAQVRLRPGRLTLVVSRPALLGRWLNVELAWRQTAAQPELERLRVGRLPLPAALAMPLLRMLAARHGVNLETLREFDAVERVTITQGLLRVHYRLDRDDLQRLRAVLLSPAERQRLRVYARELNRLAATVDGDEVALPRLLVPLIAQAAKRTASGGDAVAEHRAALLALALHATQRPLSLLVPDAAGDETPLPAPIVTLRARHDLALHFIVSAVIAAQAGTPLADAVGLWKELSDARGGGSGFSFTDLAADRAGTRFGQLAVHDAVALRQRLGAHGTDLELMPELRDLPEGLSEDEFVARYGGVGGDGYQHMLARIEQRIDALPAYR